MTALEAPAETIEQFCLAPEVIGAGETAHADAPEAAAVNGPMPYSAVNPEPPSAPVGKLTPIGNGGPTGLPPSGGFPLFR